MKKVLEKENLQIVDLTRSLAILAVLAMHFKAVEPVIGSTTFQKIWDHFQRNGSYGVSIFFVVSGFLITRIIDLGPGRLFHPDQTFFYVRRAGRILPLYLLVVFLGLLFVWHFPSEGGKKDYFFKLPNHPTDLAFWSSLFTFWFNWASVFTSKDWGRIGGHWLVFWSLAIEEQFYLFYPFLLKWSGALKKTALFLIFVVLLGFFWRLMVFLEGDPDLEMSISISFGSFDQIAMGALLYLIHQYGKIQFFLGKGAHFLIMISGLGLLVLTYWNTSIFYKGLSFDRVYGPTLVALGVFLFLLGGLRMTFFQAKYLKLFTWPGKYSYGNYLFHFSVLYFLHSFLLKMGTFIGFLTYAAISTALSAVSFHFFELPVNQIIRSLFREKRLEIAKGRGPT